MKLQWVLLFLLVFTASCSFPRKATESSVKKNQISEEDSREFYRHFYNALMYSEQGNHDSTLYHLRSAATVDSLDGGLQFELGHVYLELNNQEQALVHFQKAFALEPKNWWFATQLINLYANQKEFQSAIQIARKLLHYYPEREESYAMLIALYQQTKQFEKAIQLYTALEKITGISESISFQKIQLYMQTDNPRKALAEIDRLIAKYPFQSKYTLLKGDILLQTGQPKKAYTLYQSVLQSDPESPFVYLSLSEYFARQNNQEMALKYVMMALQNPLLDLEPKLEILGQHIEHLLTSKQTIEETESLFKLLIDFYPLEEKVHMHYAAFLQYLKRDLDAVAVYESILTINPRNDAIWLELFQVYFTRGDHTNAIAVAERAIASSDNKVAFYYYKSISLQILEKRTEAIDALLTAIRMFDTSQNRLLQSNIYAHLADLYKQNNESELAWQAYEESIRLNPENTHALNNYAYFLALAEKDLTKAEQMSAITIKKEPNNSTFLDTYAWIFYQQGMYSLAKFYIQRAYDNLKSDQNPGVILEHFGDILWMNREDEAAMIKWKKAWEAGLHTDELKQKIENNGWNRTAKE